MRSGTSFFNGPLFRKTVLRFWPLWFSYAFVLALALPVRLAGRLGRAATAVDAARTAQFVPVEFLGSLGLVAAPIIGCAAAMAVYSHLYFQRSAAAYGALPIRRGSIFCSVTLAGLVPILAVNLLAALSCLAVGASQFKAVLPAALSMFGGMSLMVTAFFGIAAFCAQLTGSIIILPILFIAVNIAAFVFESVVLSVLGEFVYGFVPRDYSLDLFSPLIGMFARSQYQSVYEHLADGSFRTVGYSYSGWAYSGGCAAVGALLLWPSGLLYRRRKLETAGDVVAIGILRPVFRYCAAIAGALLLAFLLADLVLPDAASMGLEGALIFALFMLIGGLVGWLAAEMLVQKSFRVFHMGRKWFGFGALWLLLSALLLCGELDLTGYEKRLPEQDEVLSVSVDVSGDSMELDEPENIAAVLELHESVIEGKDAYESAARSRASLGYGTASSETANTATNYNPQNLRLCYELADGRRLQRRYYISLSQKDAELLETVSNSVEGILSRKQPDIEPSASTVSYASVSWVNAQGEPESLELSGAEAAELYWNCILPDMQDGNIGLVWYARAGAENSEVYDCRVSMELVKRGAAGEDYGYFYTYATLRSERTNAWLLERGVLLKTPEELGNDWLIS